MDTQVGLLRREPTSIASTKRRAGEVSATVCKGGNGQAACWQNYGVRLFRLPDHIRFSGFSSPAGGAPGLVLP
jgi:hypothetical protein